MEAIRSLLNTVAEHVRPSYIAITTLSALAPAVNALNKSNEDRNNSTQTLAFGCVTTAFLIAGAMFAKNYLAAKRALNGETVVEQQVDDENNWNLKTGLSKPNKEMSDQSHSAGNGNINDLIEQSQPFDSLVTECEKEIVKNALADINNLLKQPGNEDGIPEEILPLPVGLTQKDLPLNSSDKPYYYKVLPGLFVGNGRCHELVDDMDVKHLICPMEWTQNLNANYLNEKGIELQGYQIGSLVQVDGSAVDQYLRLDYYADVLYRCIHNGGVLLYRFTNEAEWNYVIVLAYLIKYHGLSFEEAFLFVTNCGLGVNYSQTSETVLSVYDLALKGRWKLEETISILKERGRRVST